MVKDILAFLSSVAPFERKMDFDNVGLLVGSPESDVRKILVALDITDKVIGEAVDMDADLIVSHHPLFFDLKNIRDDDPSGRKIMKLVKNDISAICMHTNLDVAAGGVNDALAAALGLSDTSCLIEEGYDDNGRAYGLGRIGTLPEKMEFDTFLDYVKKSLSANGLRYVGGRSVSRIAVCGGSGSGELMDAYLSGCDTYVTADVKYKAFLDAAELGINLIDAGHFPTENVITKPLSEMLRKNFPDIEVSVSKKHRQTENFYC